MKIFIGILAFVIAACGMFFVGFFANDVLAKMPPNGKALGRLVGTEKPGLTPTEEFQSNFDFIENNFYRPVPKDKLRNAGMVGLVASLGDPHTNFLEPVVAEQFTTETRGNFVGVGARLQDDPLGTKVFSVFPDGPAKAAGLKSGDVITAVDHTSVAGMDSDKIVSRIRGKEGTKVVLTVLRDKQDKPLDIPITRRNVEIPTVEHRLVDNNQIGYIQVTNFAAPTPDRFSEAINDLNSDHIKGLIIDMRSNPGGLLSSAVDMLSLFVDNKPVVTMKGRNQSVQTAVTKRGQVVSMPYPIVVLVNEESASAAEIFTGVLRDYQKITIVGEHTYGKASVQDLFSLPGGANAKITIARYFLPSGDNISRKTDEDGNYVSGGIKPNVEEEFKYVEGAQFAVEGHDSQLDKAIDVIKSKMSK